MISEGMATSCWLAWRSDLLMTFLAAIESRQISEVRQCLS
jgi:hypothetical protein